MAKEQVAQKYCPGCEQYLSLNHFHKNRARYDGLANHCTECRKYWAKRQYEYVKKHNYMRIRWNAINNRCNNKSHNKYKYYGGKGIKNLLSIKDLETLWRRDKANLLKEPSIDRINSNGDYTLVNCRFIELKENRKHKK